MGTNFIDLACCPCSLASIGCTCHAAKYPGADLRLHTTCACHWINSIATLGSCKEHFCHVASATQGMHILSKPFSKEMLAWTFTLLLTDNNTKNTLSWDKGDIYEVVVQENERE